MQCHASIHSSINSSIHPPTWATNPLTHGTVTWTCMQTTVTHLLKFIVYYISAFIRQYTFVCPSVRPSVRLSAEAHPYNIKRSVCIGYTRSSASILHVSPKSKFLPSGIRILPAAISDADLPAATPFLLHSCWSRPEFLHADRRNSDILTDAGYSVPLPHQLRLLWMTGIGCCLDTL